MSDSVIDRGKRRSSTESIEQGNEKQEASVLNTEEQGKDKKEEPKKEEKSTYVDKDVLEDAELFKALQGMPFYHGFLPREDLQKILIDEGDYLIRVSEVATKKKEGTAAIKRDIVLSLCDRGEGPETKSEGERKMRNMVIRRYDGMFGIKAGNQFANIEALLANYHVDNAAETKDNRFLKTPMNLQTWEIRHSDVKLLDKLGEGAYGEVRKGSLKRKGREQDVAVKLMKGSGDMNKVKIREMMKEARLMRNFKHRNVVRFYGVAVLEQPLYILLELVNGGALNTHLQKNKNVTTMELLAMCLGAAHGLQYLHTNHCIHRDIAARNCLYSIDKVVKLSDFGLSLIGTSYKLCTSQKLPIKWLAPETITTLFFTPKTDVYSYGVMCYEIFAEGEEPWEGITNTEAKKNVVFGRHLQMPESCPEKLRTFIHEKLFVVDPKKRVMMEEFVQFMEPLIAEIAATCTTSTVSTVTNPPEKSERAPKEIACSTPVNARNDSAKVAKSKARKKLERTKKEKKKKRTSHPGNHNMIEK
uniref:Tyrosine-protein kinase n=1 Tax=Caenorhabditis japonica TaxID=281687 RepID=A0A8R1DN04_CAEJA